MTLVTIDLTGESSCEAEGHPTECTAVVSGQIQQDSTHGVTVTDGAGDTRQVATKASSALHFDSHAHTYDGTSCVDEQSHDLDPDAAELHSSVTINGSPLYISGTGVTTDPGSGGNVNIL